MLVDFAIMSERTEKEVGAHALLHAVIYLCLDELSDKVKSWRWRKQPSRSREAPAE